MDFCPASPAQPSPTEYIRSMLCMHAMYSMYFICTSTCPSSVACAHIRLASPFFPCPCFALFCSDCLLCPVLSCPSSSVLSCPVRSVLSCPIRSCHVSPVALCHLHIGASQHGGCSSAMLYNVHRTEEYRVSSVEYKVPIN